MKKLFYLSTVLVLLLACQHQEITTPLPSWQNESQKNAIIDFVSRVSDANHPDFVPQKDRIAVFDNDGTLWCESPAYLQLYFAIDLLHQRFPQHPEWKNDTTLSAFMDGSWKKKNIHEHEILTLLNATHGDISLSEFQNSAKKWSNSFLHKTLKKPISSLTYQPMVELVDYLHAHQFEVYICTGGGQDLVRTISYALYGIPEQNVVGSQMDLDYAEESRSIQHGAHLNFLNDKQGKPIGIHRVIGKPPILVGGNSDGDLQMFQYGATSKNHLNILIHHTDGEREFAYDRDSKIGKLNIALDEAKKNNWLIVDMANDWSTIFKNEK